MDQTVHTNPITDELVVRDADGKFKILKGGKLQEWSAGKQPSSRAAPSAAKNSMPLSPPPLPSRVAASVRAMPSSPPASQDPSAFPAPKAASRFYMDVNDEEDIARYRGTADNAHAVRLNQRADRVARDLIAASGLQIAEEVKPRLVRAVVSRLKDVRDLLETREVLTRPAALGGVGLENAAAHTLLKRIEEARAKFEENLKIETIPQEVRVPPAEKPQTTVQEVPPLPRPPARPFVHPSYRGDELGITNKELRPSADRDADKRVRDAKFETLKENKFPTGHVRNAVQARPRVEEVRAVPRVVGPVDELRLLTLEDLRRLAPTPQGAAEKVREKVELLADESLIRRSEGVVAWKSSPVHQLYLALGRESMEKGMPVRHMIEEWTKKNRPVLTQEEFDAIADLNQKLAY